MRSEALTVALGMMLAACPRPTSPQPPARLIDLLAQAEALPRPPPPMRLLRFDHLPKVQGQAWVGIPVSVEPERAFVVRASLADGAHQEPFVVRSLTAEQAREFGSEPHGGQGEPPGQLLGPGVKGSRIGGWTECQRFDHLPAQGVAALVVFDHPEREARSIEVWDADLPDARVAPGPQLSRLVRRLPAVTTTGVSWRSALVARPGDRYAFRLRVPAAATLSVGMGYEPGVAQGAERFQIRQDGVALFDEVVAHDHHWHDVRLPLHPQSEATSLLEFETLAADGGEPRGAWTAPLILSDGAGSEGTRPNVVLVTIDAARFDHLSAYGYPLPTTPNLSTLTRVGARFDRATAQATRTWESILSIQSGRYPATSGVRHRGMELPPEVPLLSDLLSARGYETLAGSDLALYPPASLSAFDEAEQVPAPKPGKRPSVQRQFARWAPRLTEHATFVWMHLENAHYPLLPTLPQRFDPNYQGRFRDAFTEAEHLAYPTTDRVTPEEEQHLIALYDSALVDADAELGSMLAELDRVGASSNTVVIVVADHGELLGEHGQVLEHSQPYDDVLHVPLVMAWPGHILPGLSTASRVQLIDVAPTILGLLGLPIAPGLDGRDLSSFLLTTASLPDAPAFAELDAAVFSQYRGGEHLIYDPGHRAVARGPDETPLPVAALFDVDTDPRERREIADGGPRAEEAVQALRTEMEVWSAAQRANSHSAPGQSALEALRTAGYVH